MNPTVLLWSLLLSGALFTANLAHAATFSVDVFTRGEAGYHTFRIPSLIAAADGTLIALAEGRRAGTSDAGDIDLVQKRSTDGGRSWSRLQGVWDDGPNTCGNPCPVLDRRTGTLVLLMTHNLGADRESQIVDGTSRGTRTVWASRSADHGRTWSAPRDITPSAKQPNWTWYATGPGVAIQLRSGRLVVPCDHIEATTKRFRSHVILSDDAGATWRIGGTIPDPDVNECQIVELNDGRLLLNMRNYDRTVRARAESWSADGGETWSRVRLDPLLVEPTCQAGLVRGTPADGADTGPLLFSNPAHPTARRNMTVRWSFDDGETWPLHRLVDAAPSAYSCPVALPDGAVGLLYERGETTPYEVIRFIRLEAPPHPK